MNQDPVWRRYLRFWGPDVEGDIDDELEFHLSLLTDRYVATGSSPAEARARALREFGDISRAKRLCRQIDEEELRRRRRAAGFDALRQDVRHSLRMLRRNVGFAAIAILVMAMGIGSNTSIFSAVNAALLRPLPFADPDRLVMLWESNPEKDWHKQVASPANFLDWRARVPGLADAAAYGDFDGRVTLTGVGQARAIRVSGVTGNLFSVLGARPALGRTLRFEETWSGREKVAVLSHAGWQRHFGGAAEVLGRTVRLDGVPFTVVGVMPAGFAFPAADVDAWIPIGWDAADLEKAWFRRAHFLRVIGRLQPTATVAQANAQLVSVARQLEQRYPDTNRLMGAGMTPLQEFLAGDTRTPLLILLGAVGLLLLLACANVGNLLLVRAMGRRHELALRTALGAGRGRLVRQAITESLVLSILAGLLGLGFGWAGIRALAALLPAGLGSIGKFGIDAAVLGFTGVVTIASGLLFAIAPALWSARTESGQVLRQGGRGAGPGRESRRATGILVAAEVALALVLVAGAGLLVRSFDRLGRVNPGFDPEGVLAITLDPPAAKYDDTRKVVAFYDELIRRVEALPGVESAAAAGQLPLAGVSWTSDFTVDGWPANEYGSEVAHREVTPGYFRAMRVPLLRGRAFTPQDDEDAPHVIAINESLAKRFFPGQDPIGKRLAFDRVPDSTSVWRTIVAVVGDERQAGLAEAPRIEIYAPLPQEPRSYMSLVVRSAGDPTALVPAIRRVLEELDPDMAPYAIRTMEEVRAASISLQRFLMALLTVLAGVALVLAVIGVYGVTAQAAKQRTREIGIRMALGARPRDVGRMVVRQGAALIAVGVALGMVVTLAAARSLASLLYETRPTDLPTLAAVAVILSAASLAAATIPALRARRTDPLTALRSE